MFDRRRKPLGSLLRSLDDDGAIGIFCKATDESFIEATAYSGLDFVIIDCEHGPVGRDVLKRNLMACRAGGVPGVVRTPGVDVNAIGAALDLGADGVQIPNISSVKDAEKAVAAARFHPLGMRGVCRFVAAADYGRKSRETYFASENEKLLILQIEGAEGVAALDDILNIPGFDVIFIGPYDLSQAAGIPGEIDAREVQSMITTIQRKAMAKKIQLGLFVDNVERARAARKAGFSYVACGVDVDIFRSACAQMMTSWRGE